MSKVEVYKNSEGELFENEKDYIVSESNILRKGILENWERLTKIIKKEPELYYRFIQGIGNQVIDSSATKEELQTQLDNVLDIFKKEKDIHLSNYRNSGEQIEHKPYIWGNDILDGYDVNR